MEFLAKANFFELIGYFVLSCAFTAAVLAYGHKTPYEVIIFVGFTSAILAWLQTLDVYFPPRASQILPQAQLLPR